MVWRAVFRGAIGSCGNDGGVEREWTHGHRVARYAGRSSRSQRSSTGSGGVRRARDRGPVMVGSVGRIIESQRITTSRPAPGGAAILQRDPRTRTAAHRGHVRQPRRGPPGTRGTRAQPHDRPGEDAPDRARADVVPKLGEFWYLSNSSFERPISISSIAADMLAPSFSAPWMGAVPRSVFPARHAGLRSGGMGTVSDDIGSCESTQE